MYLTQIYLQLKEARISSVLSEPQRALLGFISSGQEAISRAETELMTKVKISFFQFAKHTALNRNVSALGSDTRSWL